MQYLGLALYAEGKTDYYFLRPLLQRLCEELCTRESNVPVDVSEVLSLDHPASMKDAPREHRIFEAAKMAQGAWKIVFVHADGASEPLRARQEQVDPSLEMLRAAGDLQGLGVAVIPIRETEAWAVADSDAVRLAFGTELSDSELGLPSRRAVEANIDPKMALQAAFKATHPSSRRRRQGVSPYLSTLGEQVSLSRLRELPSFSTLENELRCALQQLGIIRTS